MMSAIIEPFFYCLLASMIWAPIVFLTVSFALKDKPAQVADKLWPSALIVAALPAMFAPFAAALGLSLRTPPPPLPPMGEPVASAAPAVAFETVMTAAPVTSLSLADIFSAAAGLYFYGFLLFMALGLFRLVWFAYRVCYAFEAEEPRLEAGLELWRQRIGLKYRPRYAFTDVVSSVCVHGFFRPVILMPMNLLDKVSVDDAILMGAHEMAHIKRGDTWLFAFATAIKSVFWFNPFVHRIAARANLAAEQAADRLVIDSGAGRKQYAQCFVEGLRFAAGAPRKDHALVPSFTPFDKHSRRERLNAILSATNGTPLLSLSSKIGLAISIVFAAGIAFAQAALAVAPKHPGEALPQAPIEGRITFGYEEKSAVLGKDRPHHEGVDIAAPTGTPVKAAGDGKVIDATGRYKGKTSWGNVVVLDHGHGLVTRYAHMDSYSVKKGDRVKAGDVIGAVGSTGKSKGPHLHFEVIRDGETIDPTPVLGALPVPVPAIKATQNIKAAPMPAAVPMPRAVSGVVPKRVTRLKDDYRYDNDLEEKLEGRFSKFSHELRDKLNNFELFAELGEYKFEIDEKDFVSAEEFEKLVEELPEVEFQFDFDEIENVAIELPKLAYLQPNHELSDEDKEQIKRDIEQANREIAQALQESKQELREAQKEAEREWKRAEKERQRERAEWADEIAKEQAERIAEQKREHAERKAELAREQAERDVERALEKAERQAERQLERAERQWAINLRENGQTLDEQKILELRKQAILEAQEDLARELEEIKRQQAELKKQQRDLKKKKKL